MEKILKEPLLHFLLGGLLLFAVYGILNNERDKNNILIDDNLIGELSAKWEMKRNRKPTLQEIEGLIEQYIEQEVLYLEALAMNLDHNDEIIKRRLAQKLEFISDEFSESLHPSEEMLINYYEENKENYKKPTIYTFQQVYFSNDKRINALQDAKNALNTKNPEKLGDHTALALEFSNVDVMRIDRDLGFQFTSALDTLATKEWTGPIISGLGVHIVYISERKSARYYNFNEIVERVNIDYNYWASKDFKKELISTFLKNYTINIESDDKELKRILNEKF